jgi:putative MATE family efflux protein
MTASPSRFDRSIVEGPLSSAVWKIAWPSMLTNIIGGLQGMVDHILVGRLVGSTANAAIGVSWQLLLVVIVFISSLFTGMNILVARAVGAGDGERADRVVYQAFLTAAFLAFGILAPIGYVAAPWLLGLVHAKPEVVAEALPFLRVQFLFSGGMLVFFMLGGALRSAGDAKTPMRFGIALTILNLTFNIILIRGLGPIPAFGTVGAAMGQTAAAGILALYAIWRLIRGGWVVRFPRGGPYRPDWEIIRALFKLGLPTGVQGIAMNIGGVMMLSFMGSLALSAQAQAAFAVSYTELFSLVTWSSVGLMGAAAAVTGQNIGAGHPDRASQTAGVAARLGLTLAGGLALFYFFLPRQLLAVFGMTDPAYADLGVQLLRVLAFSGLFITVALTYTGALQGAGDTKSPLYISIFSQVLVPVGICTLIGAFGTLQPMHIWLAILAGHMTRCGLSVSVFSLGRWRTIKV